MFADIGAQKSKGVSVEKLRLFHVRIIAGLMTLMEN